MAIDENYESKFISTKDAKVGNSGSLHYINPFVTAKYHMISILSWKLL